VVTDSYDDVTLVAALLNVPVTIVSNEGCAKIAQVTSAEIREEFRSIASRRFVSPFGDTILDFRELAELCGFWRRLIDSNRSLTAAVGLAFWKRGTVAPLLWGGSGSVLFGSRSRRFGREDHVALWKSRTSGRTLRRLQETGAEIIEVEDGFIRSVGLGADCVPPLSIVADRLGIYFDPNRPSELEQLLQNGQFSEELIVRANSLRALIVRLGIGKYGAGGGKLERRSERPHLLVVGQVEDDRAVTLGLGPRTNLELLRQVRQANPDAYIVYRPHPDVEAGHRRGGIADEVCLRFADEIIRDGPISPAMELVDEVHVNTSLAGFEALLRGKRVTTYGVPFYAGWGLTRDRGPVPSRRNVRRSLDELVAATLLLYPRYLDPVTGLPCPPEMLVTRIGEGSATASPTPIVHLRRLQGRWRRTLSSVWADRK
jgi:capsular polysaccharide export protein